ncbi:hypothetical protein F4776DRAFT_333503 [Hypoxylon sp. NC0597]|nr:hypothetical protein F4776DRAFT_333503 [Hypoxylon sp. NC0597]
MSVEVSATCPSCGLRRGFWHIPILIAERLNSYSPISDSEEPIDVLCLSCQIDTEDGIVEALSAIEHAPAEIFREYPEWSGVQNVLGDLLYYLARKFEPHRASSPVSIPFSVEESLLRTVYRWKEDVLLDTILLTFSSRMHRGGKEWRKSFVRRLAQIHLDKYFKDLKKVFGGDAVLDGFESSTKILKLRLKTIETTAELEAFFRAVDRQFEIIWGESRSDLAASLQSHTRLRFP